MTAIGFALATIYLAYFYFFIDYGIEKEMLFVPLFTRGMASVIISIVFLTSIVQSGLHFFVFPQALTVNGFTGAVMGATRPAVIGEALRHTMAENAANLSAYFALFDFRSYSMPLHDLYGLVQRQARCLDEGDLRAASHHIPHLAISDIDKLLPYPTDGYFPEMEED